ncbi:MAG TPA: heme-copper oxidase subunit III [Pirellulales bacterium]|jgi:cytochrome c oxidase subunit 3/cytochrome o ubiquinol oxidase subunit 3
MSEAHLTSAAATGHGHHRGFPAADFNEEHRVQVGMACFICSEAAFFSTLIVAYITYLGKDTIGPTPAEVLRWPLVIAGTIALVSSSFTVHWANSALRQGDLSAFRRWLAATILLGIAFLAGTAAEWRDLIVEHGLTIGTNLFGTTYFTLVGFHALHVTVGVIVLTLMLALSAKRFVSQQHQVGFEVVSWYWHLVDSVWLVVFTVVYVIGR